MDEVEVVAYRADWAAMFEEEAERLHALLPAELILALHHIGSTAVPGLAAKPVIDLIALAADLAAARARLIEPLQAAGYGFWADNPAKDRLFFVRGLPPAPHRTHHLHIVDDPKVLDRHLAFRDLLRTNPDKRGNYQAVKETLAARHRTDREAYTAAKADFIAAALA